MKRASYRDAIFWIAANDGDGDSERLDESFVAEMVSVLLVADVFHVEPSRVARDVVRKRKQHEKETA